MYLKYFHYFYSFVSMTISKAAINNMKDKNSAVAVESQDLGALSDSHDIVLLLEKLNKEIRRSRINGVDVPVSKNKKKEIMKLKTAYIRNIGTKYHSSNEDFAKDFVADYFSILDSNDRSPDNFTHLYNDDSVIGYNGTGYIRGQLDVIDSLMVTICYSYCCMELIS